ncbi:MAG UNVERIFIED_CONTAM: Rpn family recombination-promoting nuclease/putative transposase [Rickettsiaceae bacterium]|jgi:predicted transposase/invertase (TIGR01784 family)
MGDINPRVDIAFKKIFGVEENKDLLISLINSVVSDEDQVKEITLLNPYNPQNFRNDKLSILDIKAIGETGKRYNIEIQLIDEADYDKRALYYWGKLYTEQLQSGNDYNMLNKAIGIHILNFTSILEHQKYHNVFRIKEVESNIEYFKDLELHTIELKKFGNDAGNDFPQLMSRIKSKVDLWAAFLTKYDLLNKNKLTGSLNDPSLKKALTILDVINLTKEEREEYESHLNWLRLEASGIKKAEDKGREEGVKEGIKEGEKSKAIEIAKNMLSQNLDLPLISSLTGLSEKEINNLK